MVFTICLVVVVGWFIRSAWAERNRRRRYREKLLDELEAILPIQGHFAATGDRVHLESDCYGLRNADRQRMSAKVICLCCRRDFTDRLEAVVLRQIDQTILDLEEGRQ